MRKDHARSPEGAEPAARHACEELLAARFPSRQHAELEVEMSPAIPLSTLGLDAAQQGSGLDALSNVGWRFIIIIGGSPVGLADVGLDRDGTPQFRQLNYGPYVESLPRAYRRGVDQVARRGGELELISVPALYLLALWHDAAEGDGSVTVLAPAPPPFEPGVEYREDEFDELLTETARQVGPDGSALPERPRDDDHDQTDRPDPTDDTGDQGHS